MNFSSNDQFAASPNLGLATSTQLGNERATRYNFDLLDMAAQPVVKSIVNAPPGSPAIGDTHLVGTAGTGAFAGHNNDMARLTKDGWIFLTAKEGWSVWNIGTGALLRRAANGTWA